MHLTKHLENSRPAGRLGNKLRDTLSPSTQRREHEVLGVLCDMEGLQQCFVNQVGGWSMLHKGWFV